MGFGKGVGDELTGETNADFQGIGTGMGEHPVIKSAAAAETSAVAVEGEAGAKESVDPVHRNLRQVGQGFLNAKCTRFEIKVGIFHGMEVQGIANDFWIEPAAVRVLRDEIRQIGFVRAARQTR